MEKYHKYVFNVEKREFVGKFEEMYQNESNEVFDSWHQEDGRQLQRRIALAILQDYIFKFIIDIGCGKGAFTHQLKKMNNKVLGIDVSPTALAVARERYPDMDFTCVDVKKCSDFENLLSEYGTKADLILASEILSYIENWRELLEVISRHTECLLINLYIPENPIGFVKSEDELVSEYAKHFEIIQHVSLRSTRFVVLFGKSRRCR